MWGFEIANLGPDCLFLLRKHFRRFEVPDFGDHRADPAIERDFFGEALFFKYLMA